MRAEFKKFESSFGTWEALFQQAADFLTMIGPERTIGVSHSHEKTTGVITVWYWSEAPKPMVANPSTPPARTDNPARH